MCTKVIEISFKDLLKHSNDNLHETVPLSQAVKATLEANGNCDVPQCELYKTWAVSLFRQYGVATIKGSELNQLLELFSSITDQLLRECQEDKVHELAEWLDYTLDLFNWIQSVAGDFTCDEISRFLCFGLSVVSSFLVFFSCQANRRKTDSLLEKSLSIQHTITSIILDNLKTFNFDNDSGLLLDNLIQHLCTVGELTSKLDIKTAIDTWKGITKLACQNVPPTHSNRDSLIEISWLKKPVCFLVKEINRNVQTVYKETSLGEDIDQIKKYLKVTNFYLKLLQKLAVDFNHTVFPAYPEFLNTLAIILRPPSHVGGTEVYNVVTDYVVSGFKELLTMVWRNQVFFDHLLDEEWTGTDGAFYDILLEVIELSIQRSDTEYLSPRVLNEAFGRLSKNFHIFMSSPIYHRFIESFSALYIHHQTEHLLTILVDSVLQDDIVLASTAMDIWCIISQYNHSHRIEYFTFWRDLNESFARFSDQLSALHVELLLKRLYMLLSSQEKAELWDKFNVHDAKSDRFLLTIGLNAVPNEAVKHTIIHSVVTELEDILKGSSNGMTVNNYYAIVKNLKLLTPITFLKQHTIDVVHHYFKVVIRTKKLTALLEGMLDFLASKLEMIDHSKILKILTDLSMELNSFNDHSTKWSIAEFLRSVSKIPQLERHSTEMLKILETDEVIKYLGNSNDTWKEDIPFEGDENLLRKVLQSRTTGDIKTIHVCPVDDVISPERKKRKTNVDVLIESIEKDVDKLMSQIQLEELDPSKVDTILRVAKKLNAAIAPFS